MKIGVIGKSLRENEYIAHHNRLLSGIVDRVMPIAEINF